jgi:hypothetical protein
LLSPLELALSHLALLRSLLVFELSDPRIDGWMPV